MASHQNMIVTAEDPVVHVICKHAVSHMSSQEHRRRRSPGFALIWPVYPLGCRRGLKTIERSVVGSQRRHEGEMEEEAHASAEAQAPSYACPFEIGGDSCRSGGACLCVGLS